MTSPIPVDDWIRRRPIAHRGLHTASAGRPENSLPAFRAAAEAGYPVELDVRLSRDGRVVVIHDERLDRVTDAGGAVADLTLAELRSVRLAGSSPEAPATVPAFTEVLAEIAGRVPILIEIKATETPGALEEQLLAELGASTGPVAVASFSPLALAWFREHAPGILRGQLSGTFADSTLDASLKDLLSGLAFNEMVAPAFVAYELSSLPHPAPAAAREAGLPLIAWTARTPAELTRAREVADNVIFEGLLP